MNKLSRFLVIAIAASSFLLAFSQRGIGSYLFERYLSFPMLEPSEKIDEMVITTGTESAFPLWTVCSPKKVNDHSINADCGELSVCTNLAIGHTFGVMDLADPNIRWEDLNWKLSLDGHPIDLEAFGVHDFVHIFHPSHSNREVSRVLSVWNVALVNPALGMHQLQGQAQSPDGAEPYTWVVKFTVANPSQTALLQNQSQSDLY